MTTPRDVVLASLAVTIPASDPERPDVEQRADLIVAALIQHGFLHVSSTEPTRDEVHDVARWLADASRHPRYVAVDGWRKLLESDADVEVAAHAALRNASQREAEDIGHAKRTLLTYGRRWADG